MVPITLYERAVDRSDRVCLGYIPANSNRDDAHTVLFEGQMMSTRFDFEGRYPTPTLLLEYDPVSPAGLVEIYLREGVISVDSTRSSSVASYAFLKILLRQLLHQLIVFPPLSLLGCDLDATQTGSPSKSCRLFLSGCLASRSYPFVLPLAVHLFGPWDPFFSP